MKEKKKFKISILGQNYSINTDENEEIIHEAAQIVSNMMQEGHGAVDESCLAVLVALQLAVKLTNSIKTFEKWEKKADKILSLF